MSAEDPGFEKLEDGTLIIGPAAARASMKRAEKEAFEHGQTVLDKINEETEKSGDDSKL